MKSKLFTRYYALKTIWILFLDNSREETSYMTLEMFKKKGEECKFSIDDCHTMLEVYSRAGIIIFFSRIEKSDDENYLFFAPSFLAQALGTFIRDSTFHQLAFRLDKNNFPFYRKYIDTGKINKKYSQKERNYVLKVALEHFVLFRVEKEKDIFIVPELLHPIDNKIKPASKSDILLIHNNYWTLSDFVKVFNWLLKDEN
eukprot:snap_masked-scaffold_23-processed-gene-2.33-mRNA-1 protein AED:1.00 eAED:1.00 QI:0/0/0/0/1/1/2/0/199